MKELDVKELELFAFDWSGTVSDDRQPVWAAVTYILDKYKRPRIKFHRFMSQTRDAGSLIDLLSLNGIHDDPGKLYELYREFYSVVVGNGWKPEVYPHVLDIFQYLNFMKKKVAIVSSHPQESLEREAEEYGLSPLIHVIKGDSRDKAGDLMHTCQSTGTELASTLYITDSIFDIRAAKYAGVYSAGVGGGYHPRRVLKKENPDLLLKNLSHLKKHFSVI